MAVPHYLSTNLKMRAGRQVAWHASAVAFGLDRSDSRYKNLCISLGKGHLALQSLLAERRSASGKALSRQAHNIKELTNRDL